MLHAGIRKQQSRTSGHFWEGVEEDEDCEPEPRAVHPPGGHDGEDDDDDDGDDDADGGSGQQSLPTLYSQPSLVLSLFKDVGVSGVVQRTAE